MCAWKHTHTHTHTRSHAHTHEHACTHTRTCTDRCTYTHRVIHSLIWRLMQIPVHTWKDGCARILASLNQALVWTWACRTPREPGRTKIIQDALTSFLPDPKRMQRKVIGVHFLNWSPCSHSACPRLKQLRVCFYLPTLACKVSVHLSLCCLEKKRNKQRRRKQILGTVTFLFLFLICW